MVKNYFLLLKELPLCFNFIFRQVRDSQTSLPANGFEKIGFRSSPPCLVETFPILTFHRLSPPPPQVLLLQNPYFRLGENSHQLFRASLQLVSERVEWAIIALQVLHQVLQTPFDATHNDPLSVSGAPE